MFTNIQYIMCLSYICFIRALCLEWCEMCFGQPKKAKTFEMVQSLGGFVFCEGRSQINRGPARSQGKCAVLFKVRTEKGWEMVWKIGRFASMQRFFCDTFCTFYKSYIWPPELWTRVIWGKVRWCMMLVYSGKPNAVQWGIGWSYQDMLCLNSLGPVLELIEPMQCG